MCVLNTIQKKLLSEPIKKRIHTQWEKQIIQYLGSALPMRSNFKQK